MYRPATSCAAVTALRLRATTRHGARSHGPAGETITFEIEQGFQDLGRLRTGDEMFIAEDADRHTGDAQCERALMILDHELGRRRSQSGGDLLVGEPELGGKRSEDEWIADVSTL